MARNVPPHEIELVNRLAEDSRVSATGLALCLATRHVDDFLRKVGCRLPATAGQVMLLLEIMGYNYFSDEYRRFASAFVKEQGSGEVDRLFVASLREAP